MLLRCKPGFPIIVLVTCNLNVSIPWYLEITRKKYTRQFKVNFTIESLWIPDECTSRSVISRTCRSHIFLKLHRHPSQQTNSLNPLYIWLNMYNHQQVAEKLCPRHESCRHSTKGRLSFRSNFQSAWNYAIVPWKVTHDASYSKRVPAFKKI